MNSNVGAASPPFPPAPRTVAVELLDAPVEDLLWVLKTKHPSVEAYDVRAIESKALLAELSRRGGTTGAVADAQLLVIQKSQDYNQPAGNRLSANAALEADRDSYFPFGLASYVHMLHVKAQRAVSLVRKQQAGGEPNFEGLRDTALDLINYASFLVERMDRGDLK